MALNYHGLPVEVEGVSAVTSTNTVDLGTERIFAGEKYVYVYNDSAGPIYPGFGLVMSGNTGMSVTLSSTTFFNVCIGMVKHVTFLTAQYGWALTKGFTNIKMHANSSGVVGDPVFLGPAGTAYGSSVLSTLTTSYSQATLPLGLVPFGVCVQATASAGTGYAYVSCFGG